MMQAAIKLSFHRFYFTSRVVQKQDLIIYHMLMYRRMENGLVSPLNFNDFNTYS